MARRGRWIAVFLGVLAAAVPAVGVLGFKQDFVEEWYLWKLRSADREESDLAAAKLASLSSSRAVEPLISAIRKDGPEAISVSGLGRRWKGETHTPLGIELPPKAYALYQLGRRALPPIESALKAEENPPGDPSSFILSYVRDAILGEYDEVSSKAIGTPGDPAGPRRPDCLAPFTSPSPGTRSPRK